MQREQRAERAEWDSGSGDREVMDSAVVRVGLGLLLFGGIVLFLLASLRWGHSGKVDAQTQRMARTRRRDWSESDLESGDVTGAFHLRVLGPLERPARLAVAAGLALVAGGLILMVLD